MAYTLLDAVFAGIIANVPLMAVKAMNATDVQLQLPLAMTSVGLFSSVGARSRLCWYPGSLAPYPPC